MALSKESAFRMIQPLLSISEMHRLPERGYKLLSVHYQALTSLCADSSLFETGLSTRISERHTSYIVLNESVRDYATLQSSLTLTAASVLLLQRATGYYITDYETRIRTYCKGDTNNPRYDAH